MFISNVIIFDRRVNLTAVSGAKSAWPGYYSPLASASADLLIAPRSLRSKNDVQTPPATAEFAPRPLSLQLKREPRVICDLCEVGSKKFCFERVHISNKKTVSVYLRARRNRNPFEFGL